MVFTRFARNLGVMDTYFQIPSEISGELRISFPNLGNPCREPGISAECPALAEEPGIPVSCPGLEKDEFLSKNTTGIQYNMNLVNERSKESQGKSGNEPGAFFYQVNTR